MSQRNVKFKYTGSALPGNAEVVSFFDTTNGGFGANFVDTYRIARIMVRVINDQSGTLAMQSSENRGTAWTTRYTTAVAASAANSENVYDIDVEGLSDVRIRWTNGATPQTTFVVAVAGTSERVVAT